MLYDHLVFVCALIAAFSGVLALFILDKIKNLRIALVFCAVFILSVTGIIVFGDKAHVQYNKDRVITVAFISTAHDLFLAIQTKAHNLALASNPIAGEIVLKDSATVLITPNTISKTGVSNGLSKDFYAIAINTRGQNMKLTGNLSSDNKSWCFDLSTEKDEVIYTQNGYVAGGSGKGYCLYGLAYNGSDQLIR